MTAESSGLLDRHLAFIEALRGAGMSVSLAEDIDSVAALGAVGWGDRGHVRDVLAATLVKKQAQRTTFDALFDVYFPALVGDGVRAADDASDADPASGDAAVRDNAAALQAFRDQLADGLESGDDQQLRRLAAQMVGTFGAMPGRGPGLSSWSAYTAIQRVAPQGMVRLAMVATQRARIRPAPRKLSRSLKSNS